MTKKATTSKSKMWRRNVTCANAKPTERMKSTYANARSDGEFNVNNNTQTSFYLLLFAISLYQIHVCINKYLLYGICGTQHRLALHCIKCAYHSYQFILTNIQQIYRLLSHAYTTLLTFLVKCIQFLQIANEQQQIRWGKAKKNSHTK